MATAQTYLDARFGELLRQFRLTAGLSQEALADRAALSVRAISDLERGVKIRPHFETVRLLADALNLEPTQRTALTIAARSVARAAPQLPVTESNLPLEPTSLIGREREVAAVVALLRDGVRLLTLTGPGGVGKTRLALRAAEVLRSDYADRVAFVSLAPVADPDFVVPTIAQVLGVRESAEESLRQRLIATLRERHLLLVLDNFEHLLPAASLVAELLAGCPRLTILVTSRATLNVSAEQVFPVPPLSVPKPGEAASIDGIEAVEAVRLFVARAKAVMPNFSLTNANAEAVASICRHLDGLPLAIELAAARVNILPPNSLLARLDRSLALLTGGPYDAPTRLQSMGNAIAWSYDLLSAQEQALFRRLAAFEGGLTLGTAAEVAFEGNILLALDSLTELIDQSLLQRRVQDDGDYRFQMLEPIREFAMDCLTGSGELAQIQRAHAEFFLALAIRVGPRIKDAGQASRLAQLANDQHNLRLALNWLVEHDSESALRMAQALFYFWYYRNELAEGQWWTERTLGASDALPTILRASVLNQCAQFTRSQGNWKRALSLSEESLHILRANDSPYDLAYTLMVRGGTALQAQRLELASLNLEESISLFRGLNDDIGLAITLSIMSELSSKTGNDRGAERHLNEALSLFQHGGDEGHVAQSKEDLASFAEGRGAFGEADELLVEAIGTWRKLNLHRPLARALCHLGRIRQTRGFFDSADNCFAESLSLSHNAGDDEVAATAYAALSDLARQRGVPNRIA